MKSLKFILILAFVLWIVSEVIELIIGGYNPAVYYITTAYHLTAAIGIFYFFERIPGSKRPLLLPVSIILISLTYLILLPFPIQVMQSGLSVKAFLSDHIYYKAAGLISVVGFLLFGASIARSWKDIRWIGYGIILCTLIYVFSMVNAYHILMNFNNIILGSLMILLVMRKNGV